MRQHKRRRADTLTEEELDLAVAAGEPLLRSSFAAGLDGLAEFHSYQEEWLASWQLPLCWREKLEVDGGVRDWPWTLSAGPDSTSEHICCF